MYVSRSYCEHKNWWSTYSTTIYSTQFTNGRNSTNATEQLLNDSVTTPIESFNSTISVDASSGSFSTRSDRSALVKIKIFIQKIGEDIHVKFNPETIRTSPKITLDFSWEIGSTYVQKCHLFKPDVYCSKDIFRFSPIKILDQFFKWERIVRLPKDLMKGIK